MAISFQSLQQEQEQMIAAVNTALNVGDWVQVVALTVPLYQMALVLGDVAFAELVQDLHWIAQDALVRPLEVERLVAP